MLRISQIGQRIARYPDMPSPGTALIWAFGLCATICQAANPGLVFSSALDFNSHGEIDGIAVDSAGNTYLTGWDRAATIKTTPGVVQPQFPGGSVDIFVVKLNAAGKVVFATYW
jgi:sugar lactone lactonase YvrE